MTWAGFDLEKRGEALIQYADRHVAFGVGTSTGDIMETQSAQRRRHSRQVMALIAPPSFATRTPEDTRAHRVLWMVEERFRTIVRRNALVRGNSTRLEEAVAEAQAGLAAIRDYFAGGELPPAQEHPVGVPVRMPQPIATKNKNST